ncbi:MAG TPA: hypothetical protein VH080_08335 [Gemmatimonadaceae bacterium]|jgi:hypothetical protein|nr:hypothetical protein [Gemmatimonadaceae bacterium]
MPEAPDFEKIARRVVNVGSGPVLVDQFADELRLMWEPNSTHAESIRLDARPAWLDPNFCTLQGRLRPADGPESTAPLERCLTPGTARVGFLSARNNSFQQIVQTPDCVMIHSEMIHEARIIPLAQRPHLNPAVRFWSGDSRGRWEGQTLVIDTTNFTTELIFRQKRGVAVSDEHVHLPERLTRWRQLSSSMR